MRLNAGRVLRDLHELEAPAGDTLGRSGLRGASHVQSRASFEETPQDLPVEHT